MRVIGKKGQPPGVGGGGGGVDVLSGRESNLD